MNASDIDLNAFLKELEKRGVECKVECFQPHMNLIHIAIITRYEKRDLNILNHATNKYILGTGNFKQLP
jgi:hypothetical protein